MELHYGECPTCGEYCQPEFENLNNPDVEIVQCEVCGTTWTLFHDDPDDPRDGSQPWRMYRIDYIEVPDNL